ncbi:unnamed protein product, partial [Candidula unifasciata]
MAAFPNLYCTLIILFLNVLYVPVVISDCPSYWLTVNTSSTPAQTCYRLFPNVAGSYDAIAGFCRGQGGYLARDTSAMVHNGLRATFLATSTAYPNTLFWFGLTDNNTNSWYWLGGPAVGTYNNFFNGYQGHLNSRDCGYLAVANSDFKWLTTTNCNSSHAPFCQRDYDTPPVVTTTAQPVNCPNGWYGLASQNWCIQLFNSPVSWSAAQGRCQMSGAKLVQINNSAMNTFVNQLVSQSKGLYWIGLNDQGKEGTFTWLNDTVQATYTQWASGMPNNDGGNENCVVIDGNNNNKWDDLDCSTPNRFICQRVP